MGLCVFTFLSGYRKKPVKNSTFFRRSSGAYKLILCQFTTLFTTLLSVAFYPRFSLSFVPISPLDLPQFLTSLIPFSSKFLRVL